MRNINSSGNGEGFGWDPEAQDGRADRRFRAGGGNAGRQLEVLNISRDDESRSSGRRTARRSAAQEGSGERRQEVQRRRTEGISEVQRRRTEGTSEIQRRRTEGTSEVQRRRTEGTSEIQRRRSEGASEVQRRRTEGTPEVQNRRPRRSFETWDDSIDAENIAMGRQSERRRTGRSPESRPGSYEDRMEARLAEAQRRLEKKSRNIEKSNRGEKVQSADSGAARREARPGNTGRGSKEQIKNPSGRPIPEKHSENVRRHSAAEKTAGRNPQHSGTQKRRKKRRAAQRNRIYALTGMCLLLVFVIAGAVLLWKKPFSSGKDSSDQKRIASSDKAEGTGKGKGGEGTVELASGEDADEDAETKAKDVKALFAEDVDPDSFAPHCVEATKPENFIQSTGIMVDDAVLSDVSEYSPVSPIEFGPGRDYTDLEGIVTFRGDNFRNSPAYGYAEMKEFALEGVWSRDTGSLSYSDATWTGSGWTGQPLMMKWPREMKAHMNMEDWAKEDDELVEVIYACMDGYIYFTDLKTGKATRESMYVGYTFKGAGALDPRGYPVMYVGAGYDSSEGQARVFIINLLDCSVMYTFGNADPFTTRGSLSYFDSSPLVDAETDTLIYPGENGILYLIHLSSQYDQEAGTFSINPDHVVKWNYYGIRTDVSSYWTGMETSAAIYKGYLFVADNGGNLMCMDLNTLQLVWVQDTLDDSNSTPVLSVEDGKLYVYVSTSFHLGWRSSYTANVPIWKIDAETGEIVWQTDYECFSEAGVSGGVQSTIAVGRGDLSDYIYVTVARTGAEYDGVLSCINKHTGEIVWEHVAFYAWSSPVCVYNSDGTGKVLYCSCGGKMYLLDGKTGETHDDFVLSDGAIEASPAVYENYVVVGTRSCKIWGIQLK